MLTWKPIGQNAAQARYKNITIYVTSMTSGDYLAEVKINDDFTHQTELTAFSLTVAKTLAAEWLRCEVLPVHLATLEEQKAIDLELQKILEGE